MYIRNFVRSGAFSALLSQDDFGVCVSEAVVKLKDDIPREKLAGEYQRSARNIDLVYRFNQVSMRAMRDRSATLRIKAAAAARASRGRARYVFGPLSLPPMDRLARRLLGKRFFRNDDFVFRLAALPPVYPLVAARLRAAFEPNRSVERIVEQHRPSVVLFPVTGVEATGAELILLSRKYRFKTLFLVNGWDNLSSKGVFPFLPDYLGLWGPQSLSDAVSIQGAAPEATMMLGCARYEDYFTADKTPRQLFTHKYILFAGATTPSDEITPLRILDNAVEESGFMDVKIVYRPHPWREKRRCYDVFEATEYRHVIIDPQVADSYYGEKAKGTESSSSQNFPPLEYYPALLNNALFVISPMSSMMLEAAIFDVPSLALAHDDGCHPIPPKLQAEYAHFAGAADVPGWFFVRHIDKLQPRFTELLTRFYRDTPASRQLRPDLSRAIRKYLHYDGRSYAERVLEAVSAIGADRSDESPAPDPAAKP